MIRRFLVRAMSTLPSPPAGFTIHTESTTSLLTPTPTTSSDRKDVFINPVQEYNRDLSIAVINTWAQVLDAEKRERWEKRIASGGRGKKGRGKRGLEEAQVGQNGDEGEAKKLKADGEGAATAGVEADVIMAEPAPPAASTSTLDQNQSTESVPTPTYRPYQFTALEALSATGLRAIRYAKEIPNLRWVLANDLSPSAVDAIKRNVEFNGIKEDEEPASVEATGEASTGGEKLNDKEDAKAPEETKKSVEPDEAVPQGKGKVRPNLGDACGVMYSHRAPGTHFDMIDLDPYGTAAPFMDGAVQCVSDGGLLAVTCTDLAVLAGSSYPEKCFANYGGASIKAEYSHEVALRLVLNSLSTSASRYGRWIEPLVSLSVDFYVRLFVRVWDGQREVKKAMTNTALVYVCSTCQAHHLQPLGRLNTKQTKRASHSATPGPNDTTTTFHNAAGPPCPPKCSECGIGTFHTCGPLWTGPLHSPEFIQKVLNNLDVPEGISKTLKTTPRIKGMLTIAASELSTPQSAFFFTPSKLASYFHCTSPSLSTVFSGLLNAGYQVSRSHCCPGSVKTDAGREVVGDLMRAWIGKEGNEVKMDNIKEGSCARVMLAREPKTTISLDHHPDVEKKMMTDVKILRYQTNPEANWGPKQRANKR